MNKFLAILAVLAILTIGTACSIGVPTSGSWSVDPGKGELTIRTTPWASTTVTGTNATPTATSTATATATRTSTPTATTVPTATVTINPITGTTTLGAQIQKIMDEGRNKYPGDSFDSTKLRITAVIQEIDNLTGSTAFRWQSSIGNPLIIDFGAKSFVWTQLVNQKLDNTMQPVDGYVLGDWGLYIMSGEHIMNNSGAAISLNGEKIKVVNP